MPTRAVWLAVVAMAMVAFLVFLPGGPVQRAPEQPPGSDEAAARIELPARQSLVLLDFAAEWCNPCQRLAPIIDELERDYATRLLVRRVDIDQRPDLAADYDVDGVPTLVLLRGGVEIDRHVGFETRENLTAWIEKH